MNLRELILTFRKYKTLFVIIFILIFMLILFKIQTSKDEQQLLIELSHRKDFENTVNTSLKLKRHFEFVLPVWKHKTTCDKSSLTEQVIKKALENNVINEKDHKQGYPENRKECSLCQIKVKLFKSCLIFLEINSLVPNVSYVSLTLNVNYLMISLNFGIVLEKTDDGV